MTPSQVQPDEASTNTLLLSGGLDSATALAMLSATGAPIDALFIDLGQPARDEERRSARQLVRHFDVELHELRIDGLVVSPGEIAGRNLLLVSAALAVRSGRAGTIVLGVHAGTPYFDCGAQFLADAQRLVDGYHGGAVQLSAPFVNMTKGDIARLAHAHDVPFDSTYSCERAAGPCGRCLSCADREGLDAAAA